MSLRSAFVGMVLCCLACLAMAVACAAQAKWAEFWPWLGLGVSSTAHALNVLAVHLETQQRKQMRSHAEAQVRALFFSVHQRAERERALRQGAEKEFRS